ncbi:helix-turn-helix transcriptional regulator [Acetobacter persici]|uniref:helix-turn-helix transcriptional regulator n=1 Tax=Acetobacter persici TaxID=1076596 RepID=UPI001BAC21D1|nr:autoinducer binding domain-containing protein [Acetobacter persici]MBS1015568.1 autoinducer binding domain-containing protein [Acetobacter persici]
MPFKYNPPTLILPTALQELVSAISTAHSLEELSDVVRTIPEKCNMFHVVYYFAGSGEQLLDPHNFISTTYPRAWQERYYTHGYLHADPVLKRSMESGLPFEWRELEVEKGTLADTILQEAQDFTLGHSALTLPLAGVDGSHGLFVITSLDPTKFDGIARISAVRDYQMLGNHVHEAYLRITAHQSSNQVDLSDEEKSCLKLAADGLLGAEISKKLKLPESVVRLCLRVARYKLGAATTDIAILHATRSGLI